MSTTANRTRGAVPTRMAAALAAVSLLAMPVPAGAQGPGRTVLLTLTEDVSLSQLADTVGALGGQVLETLELADSLLVELPTGVGAPAGSVEIPDTPMKVNGTRTSDASPLPTYKETIGASAGPEVGEGVTVALVDTGVADVPDLERVVHLPIKGVGKGDGLGHGTFLAGLIAGSGSISGVAPGATLLDVKVASKDGATSLSMVLQGLEVAARNNADVVNLSLSTESPLPPSFDPLSLALERLWDRGVTVVTAAGNEGPGEGTVGSPGNNPVLITVGALDENSSAKRDDDSVAAFSSRGTHFSGDKPDLVAPGVSLISTAAPDSSVYTKNPMSHVGDAYMRGTGTSMAAAVVSGAAAAVLQANRGLSPNGVKALLTSTAYTLADAGATGAGAGALALGDAVNAARAADVPLDPEQPFPGTQPGDWGPNEDDAALWAEFGAAWEAGDFEAARAAWAALSWQTKQWASRGWMLAVLANSVGQDEGEFKARSWAARSWAFDSWLARSWAGRSWAARSWAYDEWLARSWAGRSWAARSWAGRSWASDEWLARSWAARSWAGRSWAARSWAGRSWAARSWADEDWAARSWAARSWATQSWDSSSWSMTT